MKNLDPEMVEQVAAQGGSKRDLAALAGVGRATIDRRFTDQEGIEEAWERGLQQARAFFNAHLFKRTAAGSDKALELGLRHYCGHTTTVRHGNTDQNPLTDPGRAKAIERELLRKLGCADADGDGDDDQAVALAGGGYVFRDYGDPSGGEQE